MNAPPIACGRWLAPPSRIQTHSCSWFRRLSNQTRTEVQYENVQRLFEGDIVLDGLEIDTDLRWTLICRLATGGRVNAAQIDAEAANDNTATGQQYAAQAYASQPSEHGESRVLEQDYGNRRAV